MEIELYNRVYLSNKELFARWLCGEPLIKKFDDSYLQTIGEQIGKTAREAYLRTEVNGDEYILVITDEEPWIIGRADNKVDVRRSFGFE